MTKTIKKVFIVRGRNKLLADTEKTNKIWYTP